MNNLIASNQLTMSSRDISTYTGKSHSHVIRDIKKLYSDLYKDDPSLDDLKNIGIQVKAGVFVDVDTRGYVQYFELDRKHTDCLLTGYSAVARMKVIERWHELELQQAPKIPQTYAEALIEAGRLALEVEKQAEQLAIAAPKVAFVDKCVERSTLLTASQVGQKHKMSAIKLNKFLDELGGVYNKGVKRGRVFCQPFIDKGYGELKQTEQGHSQALFTTLGEQWINERLISEGEV